MKILIRILLFPFGFIKNVFELSKEGSRDLHNKMRFKGVKIDKGCCINDNSQIEHSVHIFENCIINNSKISSYSYIGKNCIIQNTTIGKFCSIATDVFIGLGNHPNDFFSTSPIFYRKVNPLNIKLIKEDLNVIEYKPIEIGNDVWIGTRSIILDGVKIGHGAILAANSVITKDVPAYAIVGGVPAKIIKYRKTEKELKYLLESNWWDKKLDEIYFVQ